MYKPGNRNYREPGHLLIKAKTEAGKGIVRVD